MESIVLVVHMLIALALIGLVMLQHGKGADAGASFGGGSSNTVFGSAGGATFFTRLTTLLAVVFFVTSLGLAMYSRNEAEDDGLIIVEETEEVPALETIQTEVESEVPFVEEAAAEESVVPVTEE